MIDDSDPSDGGADGGTTDWSRRNVLRATGSGVPLAFLGATGAAAAGEPEVGEQEDDEVKELRLAGEVSVEDASVLDVQENYTFVSSWSGFTVVDSHDPARPRQVAEVDVPGVGVHENYLRVDRDRLAVTSQGNGLAPILGIDQAELEPVDPDELGVQFYDVSDPTEPEHLGTWREPPVGVHGLALDGDYAYICRAFTINDSALRIIDISDPTDPTEAAEWRVEDEHPELDQPVNWLHGVDIENDFAYLAYWDAGCRVLDVSDPSDPAEVSSFGEAPDATEPAEGDIGTVLEDPRSEFGQRFLSLPGNVHTAMPSTDGDHVYVSEETLAGDPGGVRVFDVTDIDEPEEVAKIDPPSAETAEYAHFFDVTPDRLHVAWKDAGVRVFDVSDPANPGELSRYAPEGFHAENAVARLSFTISTFEGAGVVYLHPELGERRPPTIGDSDESS